MKKIIILFLITLLSACSTPQYSEKIKPREDKEKEMPATKILAMNGYVTEITEDNIIRIRVPRTGDRVEEGVQVHTDEIINLALSSLQLPSQDMPFAKETHNIIKGLLPIGKEVTVNTVPEMMSLREVKGFLYFKEDKEEHSLQSILIQQGLALLNTEDMNYMLEPTLKLQELQSLAANDRLGVWAVEGLVELSSSAEAQFTKIAEYNHRQALEVVEEFKKRGWSPKQLLLDKK